MTLKARWSGIPALRCPEPKQRMLEHFQLNPDRVSRGEAAGAPAGCDGCSPGYNLKADPVFTENALDERSGSASALVGSGSMLIVRLPSGPASARASASDARSSVARADGERFTAKGGGPAGR